MPYDCRVPLLQLPLLCLLDSYGTSLVSLLSLSVSLCLCVRLVACVSSVRPGVSSRVSLSLPHERSCCLRCFTVYISLQALRGPATPSGAEAAQLAERETAAAAAAAALGAAEKTLQQLRRATIAAQQAATKARGVSTDAELRLQAAQHGATQAAYELQQQQLLLQRLQQQHAHRRRSLKESLARDQQQQQEQAAAAAAAAAKAAAAARDSPHWHQQQTIELQRLQQRRQEAPQRTGLYVNPRWQGPPPDLCGLLDSIGAVVQQGRFSRAPLGPLGDYLFVDAAACEAAAVPPEAAQAIIEEHLGPHAGTWLVGSIGDQRLLQPLLQRHHWAPRVAVVNFNCPSYAPRLTDEALGIPKGVLTLYKAIRKETPKTAATQGQMTEASGRCEDAVMPLVRRLLLLEDGCHALVSPCCSSCCCCYCASSCCCCCCCVSCLRLVFIFWLIPRRLKEWPSQRTGDSCGDCCRGRRRSQRGALGAPAGVSARVMPGENPCISNGRAEGQRESPAHREGPAGLTASCAHITATVSPPLLLLLLRLLLLLARSLLLLNWGRRWPLKKS